MDATARAIGSLEATVALLVKSVDELAETVAALDAREKKRDGGLSVLRVGGSLVSGAAGGLLTTFGAPALAALLPLLPQR